MYSQSYGSVRPSTKINNREPSTEHNGELEMKKNESTEIADSGIGVSPTEVVISSENSEENQDELQNEEETQNKHPILKYVDETPPFEEFFAKCPDIINHIKDNYTSDPPESTLGLVTLLDRYMLNVENKTLTVFLTQKLLKHKVIQVLTEVWDHFWAQNYLTSDKPEAEDWRSLLEAILSVFTDISDVSADGAKDIVAVGSLERFLAALGPDKICVSTAETNEYVKFFGENNLTSIYNCLRWDTTTTNNAKPIFRANSGIEKMIKIKDEIKERKLESFEPWMVNVLLAMAYTLEENEENLLDEETKSDLIAFLRDHACDAIKVPERRSDGMSLSEYIEAINVLLASDKCKEELCRDSTLFDCLSQAIPTNDTDDPELIALVRCLYLLTFIEEGKKKLTENAPLKSAIEKLTTHTNKDVRKNAEGTIWNVSGLKPAELDVCNLSSDQLQHQQQHVMISYDWNHQKIAAAINLELKSLGYFTWMDIDRMSGSTLEAMARAVEQSVVILVCFSERYKSSPNCRKEAEYASSLLKPIIPIKTDHNYRADGWLGIMLGTTLYLECSSVDAVSSMMPKLVKELGNRGMLGQPQIIQTNETSTKNDEKTMFDNVSSMVNEELKEQFDRLSWDLPVENLNGAEFVWLNQLQQQSVNEFHRVLREDLGLENWRIRLKFANCIQQLNKLSE